MIQDVAVVLHELLDSAGIGHAFGGALALIQYAEPRGTVDIDVNVATRPADAQHVVELLARMGYRPDQPAESWLPAAGVRFTSEVEATVIDVFYSYDPYHAELLERARHFPFATSAQVVELPFLSPDDLVVMKLSFNRPKDWVDVESMIRAGTPLDTEAVAERLVRFRGPTTHPRVARLRALVAQGQQ